MGKKTIPFRPTFSYNGSSKYSVLIQMMIKMSTFLKIGYHVISALHLPVNNQEKVITGWCESSET